MPRATVSRDTVKKDLKNLPGGWVELRTLSFEQMLERRDNAMRMSQEVQATNSKKARVDISLANKWATQFEFKHCIVDHNLTGDDDAPLNFSDPSSYAGLDPKVGQEIQRYIDELNKEDDDVLEDFPDAHTSSLSMARNGQDEPSAES